MLFNTDAILWKNYGESFAPHSPSRFVSLTIHPDGDLSNGREHLARFASRGDAVHCLIGAGWKVEGDIARFSA
jgi:hypothetical protein